MPIIGKIFRAVCFGDIVILVVVLIIPPFRFHGDNSWLKVCHGFMLFRCQPGYDTALSVVTTYVTLTEVTCPHGNTRVTTC